MFCQCNKGQLFGIRHVLDSLDGIFDWSLGNWENRVIRIVHIPLRKPLDSGIHDWFLNFLFICSIQLSINVAWSIIDYLLNKFGLVVLFIQSSLSQQVLGSLGNMVLKINFFVCQKIFDWISLDLAVWLMYLIIF